MVNLQNNYKNVISSIETNSLSLATRIDSLLNQIMTKLPDEEQFGMTGTIFIGPREVVIDFYKKCSSNANFGLDPSTNFSISEGNCTFWFRENLEDSEFLITLIVDGLDEKSDNYIKGLIAYKISEWSHVWKIAREIWNVGELEEHLIILNQRVTPIESEEYERSVDEEAKRLGFVKELLAYDTQS